jgi:hypothetical protein
LEPSSTLSIARSSFGRSIVADLLWNGTFMGVTHLTMSSSLLKDENMLLIFGSCRGIVHCDLENPKHVLELTSATFRRFVENSGRSLKFLSLQVRFSSYYASCFNVIAVLPRAWIMDVKIVNSFCPTN